MARSLRPRADARRWGSVVASRTAKARAVDVASASCTVWQVCLRSTFAAILSASEEVAPSWTISRVAARASLAALTRHESRDRTRGASRLQAAARPDQLAWRASRAGARRLAYCWRSMDPV